VIEELDDHGLPETVQTLDVGTGGLDLLHVMEGWDRIIIIDAAELSGAKQLTPGQPVPGGFTRFTPDQVHLVEATEPFSLHHAGLAEVLALARALDRPLPPIVVFGVQPRDTDWGQGLSSEVEARLPALIDAVLEEIGEK
jgi:hydrogenase maturation protease